MTRKNSSRCKKGAQMKRKKTVTEKVLAANCKNSQKATGPNTAAGKAAAKYNAVKHGLLTKALLFENDEEKAEFQNFAAKLERDSKPGDILQEMLLEDIAVSWWKLRTAQRLHLHALKSRRKTSAAVVSAFIEAAEENGDPLSSEAEHFRKTARWGWECQELILRAGKGKFMDENKDDGFLKSSPGKRGSIGYEAKLCNSAESFLRYEGVWKRDLYRAITALRSLRAGNASDENS
jgi:hypothetical protein